MVLPRSRAARVMCVHVCVIRVCMPGAQRNAEVGSPPTGGGSCARACAGAGV